MAITYPRVFPDEPFEPMQCVFDREPLGALSRSAIGRVAFQEFVGGGLWQAHYETKALSERDYGRWHAWKLSLRGNFTFRGYDPRRCYPIAYGLRLFDLTRAVGGAAFDGTVTVTAAGGGTVSLSGLPNAFSITEGDYVSFQWLGGRHIVKFLEAVNATSGGLITAIAVDPWLRAGGTVPTAGTLIRPWCEMKLIPGSWSAERSVLDPVSFDAIQHLA